MTFLSNYLYILIPLVLFLLGFSNCYFRGGGLEPADGSVSYWWGKPLFLVITALVIYLTQGLSWTILTGTGAMEAGMCLGWGSYINAIFETPNAQKPEIAPIDWLIKPLYNYPVLWGVVGLSLRGLIWGAALSIGMLNWVFLPLGLLMGPLYWLAFKVKYTSTYFDSWKFGEILFGLVLAVGFIFGRKKPAVVPPEVTTTNATKTNL